MATTFRRTTPSALALLLAVAVCAGGTGAADPADPYVHPPEKRFWDPDADDVFLQEWVERIPTDSPVTSVAVADGTAYAVRDGALFRVAGTALEPVPGAPEAVERLAAPDGRLWVMAKGGLFVREGDAFRKVDDRSVVDVCLHGDGLVAATRDDLFHVGADGLTPFAPAGGYRSHNATYDMEDGTQLLEEPVTFGPVSRIASYGGTVYGLRPRQVVMFDGLAVTPEIADWGLLPSPVVRDLASLGSRLFIATDRGLGVLRGMSLTTLDGAGGLPFEDTTCLARGFDRDLWIGTSRGAVRMTRDGEFHFFGEGLWLPDGRVNAVAAGDKTVHIATDGGLAVLHYTPWTLEAKAKFYERHLEEWGHKRLGFTHVLHWGGDALGWVREISDNDGGHTAPYLAAMSFKYAATGDEAARAEAVNTFQAMAWLEEITGVPGLIARAIWVPGADAGQRSQHGSGGLPARWYTAADPRFEWKGDTSSDEVIAHFYAVGVFHDYAAQGADKRRAAEHLRRIADHIIGNGWKLREADGNTTRWGRWDPEYLLRPYGSYAIGLNGLQAQTFATVAGGVTGDPKFDAALRQTVEWGYHRHIGKQKLTFPPEFITPWDDRLAFESYFVLLRYAKDPMLRTIYLRSLERSWAVKRMERVPWYAFVYAAATGSDCDTADAADHLRQWPLDLRTHSYANSHRNDLDPVPDLPNYGGGTRAMTPRESGPKYDSRSALPHDGGSGGRTVLSPAVWLEDYWMGRYYGFIQAPAEEAAALPGPPDPVIAGPKGAKPYAGPPRPEGLIPGE